jgi:hypothetical protein
MDLTNLRLMSEGDKAFEKEMIETSLSYIPEVMSQLLTEIEQLDFCGVKSTAHKLKSSFFIMGIDDESILTKLELEKIDDLAALKHLYFKLEKIQLASLKRLEIELVNL